MSGKAALVTRGGTTRRRIESGQRGETLVAKRGEQAPGGAAGIEDGGRLVRQGASDFGGGDGEPGGIVRREAAAAGEGAVGVHEAAAPAGYDVVGRGKRIAIGHDEFLVMAD